MKKLRNEKPELSKKSSFYITKYRYYELKNFCLQYPDWKKALEQVNGWESSSHEVSGIIRGSLPESSTERQAMIRAYYSMHIDTAIFLKRTRRRAVIGLRLVLSFRCRMCLKRFSPTKILCSTTFAKPSRYLRAQSTSIKTRLCPKTSTIIFSWGVLVSSVLSNPDAEERC